MHDSHDVRSWRRPTESSSVRPLNNATLRYECSLAYIFWEINTKIKDMQKFFELQRLKFF